MTDQTRNGYRFLLPFWLWVILLVAIAVGVMQKTEIMDPGWANIISLATCAGGFLLLLAWFLFFAGFSGNARLRGLGVLAAVIGGLFATFKFEGVTGDMALVIARRWKPSPTAPGTLQAKETTAETNPLAMTTAFDFPQFMGPTRDGSVMNVHLSTDWKTPPKLLWKHPIGDGWAGFAVVNGNAVTLEQRGAQEVVTCYDLKTGTIVWAHAIEVRHQQAPGGVGPRSTPAIHEGLGYARGATGRLRCIHGGTGKLVWEKDILAEFNIPAEKEAAQMMWGRSGSPLIVGDTVVVPAGGADAKSAVSLVAFNRKTGDRVWTGGNRMPSYSSPMPARIAGVEQVLIVCEDYAGSHDAATGTLLWEIEWKGTSNKDANVAPLMQIGGDLVFVSKGYGAGGMLLRVALADGKWTTKTIWTSPRSLRTKFSNVVLKDGHLYGLSDGNLECVELTTGKRVWREGRYGYGQMLRVGNHLLILGETGEVALAELSPDRPDSVLGRFQAIDGIAWNYFALSGPHLIVRNSREAACYLLPLSK